jgi:exosortase/archaeosortase family protein
MSTEELIIRRQYILPIRSRIYHTAGIILCGIGILWGVTNLPWAIENLLEPLSAGLAWLVTGILQIFGEPVLQVGLVIKGPSANMVITPAGTGIFQIVILSTVIFAWAINTKKKWVGILLGIFILTAVNVLRIVTIYYCTLTIPDWIPFIEGIFWQGIMVLLVPLFWMYWITKKAYHTEKLS